MAPARVDQAESLSAQLGRSVMLILRNHFLTADAGSGATGRPMGAGSLPSGLLSTVSNVGGEPSRCIVGVEKLTGSSLSNL